MKEYNHIEIEKKWQHKWENEKIFKTDAYSDKEPFYALDMFPYPSGQGLHVGHPEGYTATDIISRFKRMQGYEVLHPMGWDAFGLPAEQYALKTGNHPADFTQKNIDNFRRQIKSLGFSYDWDREINTTNPKYFKWTQWIFIQLYNQKLAELKETPVNFCAECGTVLANEEVIAGKCERGGHPVEKRNLLQWNLKITQYAERLLTDLEELDWPESIKEMQRNWIGKSVGATVTFKIDNSDLTFDVYTTRPDTIYGVSYTVIAPEHELVKKLTTKEQEADVLNYIEQIKNKSDLERTELNKDKTGVFTGSYAINPINGEKVEIWIGDYVLATYGSGVVMAVPAHDERDYDFAKKYDLPIVQIIEGDISNEAFTGNGVHINSGELNGLENEEAKKKAISLFEEMGIGKQDINYRLRDWLFSRQRYWGEPFPIAHMEDGTIELLDEDELPVNLPRLDKITTSKTGESPLANASEWLDYTSPRTGLKGRRETNTMPQWAGSCWYYIRYIDPRNEKEFIDPILAEKWLPVDLYIGGAEHAVLHLLYARFWHKVLFDLGLVKSKEPFQRLFNQGMILGQNNEKMSKSKGNVVNPDDIVKSHGADTLRLYEMFMGPLDASIAWSEDGVEGAHRFLSRIWRLYQTVEICDENEQLDKLYNQTVKKVSEDFDKLSFNTAISQMMIFINAANKCQKLSNEQAFGFIKLLMPIAPHISEEINEQVLNNECELTYASWPTFDEKKLVEQSVEIVVQIAGKVKAKIVIPTQCSKEEQATLSKEAIQKHIEGKEIIKEIIIPGKLSNFIIK